jgi:hypothetical protein
MFDKEILYTRVYDNNFLELKRRIRYVLNNIADLLIYSWITDSLEDV